MIYLIIFEELCSMHEAYSIVSSARFCFLLSRSYGLLKMIISSFSSVITLVYIKWDKNMNTYMLYM